MADNMQELKQQKIWMLWRWENETGRKRTRCDVRQRWPLRNR
jgi:hypothetical protein